MWISATNSEQPLLARNRRADIEITTLVKWALLIVFLIIVILIIVMARTEGFSLLDGLCERTGGLFGC